MSNELNNKAINAEEKGEVIENKASDEKKAKKAATKQENFFKRTWKKFVKLCKDTAGEMKKVVWTPKAELAKSTKLVIFTVIAIGLAIAFIDTTFSYLINTIAGLVG